MPITFFERVEAGVAETKKRSGSPRASDHHRLRKNPGPTTYGRKVLFFVDDINLSPTSIVQAKELIRKYIDYEQTENDETQIVSSSGRIGFFQQLTDNKIVLRKATERLTYYQRTGKDYDIPMMSSYQAFQIDRGDTDTLNYFVDELLKQNRLLTRRIATDLVLARAANIMRQASQWVLKTLARWTRRSARRRLFRAQVVVLHLGWVPGRFKSPRHEQRDSLAWLVSRACRRRDYSIDARGLVVTLVDDRTGVDPTGRLLRASQGEEYAFQDPLTALAPG